MSAFIVSDNHINAILTYAIREWVYVYSYKRKEMIKVTLENAPAIGLCLMRANERSVNERYDETSTEASANYHFEPYIELLSPGQVIGAINCLNYQSCEYDGWQRSQAKRILLDIAFAAGWNTSERIRADTWSIP